MELKEKIEKLLTGYSLVVLKGVKIENLDSEVARLIDKDYKIQYYYENIFNGKRRVIYYEEYLILKELLKGGKNNNIAIIENNLYINYYPLFSKIDNKILQVLIQNNIEDNEIIYMEEPLLDKEIRIYTEIFSSVIMINNEYYCIYNEDIEGYDSIEEIRETYFDLYELNSNVLYKNLNYDYRIVEIKEEKEYLKFLKSLKTNKENIYLNINWNKELIEKK